MTYGTFRPDADGHEFPPRQTVERDFERMAASGVNAVRTYTVPPAWLLDAAAGHGLWLVIGLGAERSIGYLNDRGGAARLEADVRSQVRACAGHEAVLCYAVANEVPAPVARWFGPRRMERLLARLTRAVRAEDDGALVTYANYPSTEYLRLPFLDLLAFNVFIEDASRLAGYLARLQNLAGDRPLLMTELGLDSIRNGERAQAASVEAQVRTAFEAGCAGAFVYAWTDEWHRGGEDVHDWAFGLTRRDRRPKPALAGARAAFADPPLPSQTEAPHVTVVVCTHNGAATLGECLDGLMGLDYPAFDVIVVADGCSDRTAALAAEYPVTLVTTPPVGLSEARNLGLRAATGDVIAYLDDDARPDRDWLKFLVAAFANGDYAAVGGPNVPPPAAPPVAQCVDNAPGLPTHVLLTDAVAEHIPGCNMAFRRDRLEAIGGFDGRFRVAGDDVDVCWRLQERGWVVGFSAGAQVFHRRRDTVRGYLRQQRSYGRAETLLERKWPEKYNGTGHLAWRGRLYASRPATNPPRLRRARVAYGQWGSGLFQRLYTPPAGRLESLMASPEAFLVAGALTLLSALGLSWHPLLVLVPVLVAVVLLALAHAVAAGVRARFEAPRSRAQLLRRRALTAALHLLGPAARLSGRLGGGLTPWRTRRAGAALPRVRNLMIWCERWREADARLRGLEAAMRDGGGAVRRGGAVERWDLELAGGTLGAARLRMCVEDQAGGSQLVRFRVWPRCAPAGLAAWALVIALAAFAAAARAWEAAVVLAAVGLLLGGGTVLHSAAGSAGVITAIDESMEPGEIRVGAP